jgi:hypothetical protein
LRKQLERFYEENQGLHEEILHLAKEEEQRMIPDRLMSSSLSSLAYSVDENKENKKGNITDRKKIQ